MAALEAAGATWEDVDAIAAYWPRWGLVRRVGYAWHGLALLRDHAAELVRKARAWWHVSAGGVLETREGRITRGTWRRACKETLVETAWDRAHRVVRIAHAWASRRGQTVQRFRAWIADARAAAAMREREATARRALVAMAEGEDTARRRAAFGRFIASETARVAAIVRERQAAAVPT